MTNTTVFVGIHGLDMVAICLTVPRLTALGMVLVNKVCQFGACCCCIGLFIQQFAKCHTFIITEKKS